jgi:hypothetical protein
VRSTPLTAQIRRALAELLRRDRRQGRARPIAEWRAAFAAVAEEVASAAGMTPSASSANSTADRAAEQDRAEAAEKLEVRIDLAAAAATRRVAGDLCGAQRAGCCCMTRLDTAPGPSPLELVRRAEITQSTGEDWSNVALASHRATARGKHPISIR